MNTRADFFASPTLPQTRAAPVSGMLAVRTRSLALVALPLVLLCATQAFWPQESGASTVTATGSGQAPTSTEEAEGTGPTSAGSSADLRAPQRQAVVFPKFGLHAHRRRWLWKLNLNTRFKAIGSDAAGTAPRKARPPGTGPRKARAAGPGLRKRETRGHPEGRWQAVRSHRQTPLNHPRRRRAQGPSSPRHWPSPAPVRC